MAMEYLVKNGIPTDPPQKVSYAMISRKMDTVPQTISKIKSGFREIQDDELVVLVKEFMVDPDFLFGLTEFPIQEMNESKLCKQVCDLMEGLKDKMPITARIKGSVEFTEQQMVEKIILTIY